MTHVVGFVFVAVRAVLRVWSRTDVQRGEEVVVAVVVVVMIVVGRAGGAAVADSLSLLSMRGKMRTASSRSLGNFAVGWSLSPPL